jgi:AbrB family looped-hinge helix DNA binding protein
MVSLWLTNHVYLPTIILQISYLVETFMPTTILSSKGQVIIPKPIRTTHNWRPGQKLLVVDTGDGVLLKPASPFPEKTVEEVAGCLNYKGKAKTLAEMEAAIAKGVKETFSDSD